MRQMMSREVAATASINKDVIVMIDVTPFEPEGTFAAFCAKITDYSDDMEESTEEYEYMCGDETSTNSVRYRYGITGHTLYSDTAQRFVIDAKGKKGVGRRTNGRIIFPWGTIIEGPCTMTDIVTMGGAAKERLEFSFTMAFDEENDQGTGTTTILPIENQVDLGDLIAPQYIDAVPGTNTNIVEWTFPHVTETDKAKLPLLDLFKERVKIVTQDTSSSPLVTREYDLRMVDEGTDIKYICDLGTETDYSFISVITTGVVSSSLQTYKPINFVLA